MQYIWRHFKISVPNDWEILQFSKKELSVDDILDAWVLAISGSKGISNLRFLPDSFEYDSEGLPMRMAIPNFG